MNNEANTPLISIIVPVYNIIPYLPRCVESLQKQTYRNLEILLIDDGSTDDTPALCDRLAEGDARIRVFHKANGGPSSARNFGLEQAKGDYVGFVDSDDYVDADMYERLYRAIDETGMPIAQAGRDEIDKDGNILPNICEPVSKQQIIPAQEFMKELLMHRGDCSFCTKLLRKDLFRIENFPEGALNEDFHLLVKMLTRNSEGSNFGDVTRDGSNHGDVSNSGNRGGEDTETTAVRNTEGTETIEVPGIVCIPGQAYHVFYRPDSNTRDKNRFSRVFADNIDNADMVLDLVQRTWPEQTEMADIAFRFGVFQRLDYMLHIPVAQMTPDNTFYRNVVKKLRRGWWRAMRNPYLTKKNKCYHTLFAVAPRGVRVLHKKIRHIE